MSGVITAKVAHIVSRKIQIALYENFCDAQPKAAKLGTPRMRTTAYSTRFCVALTTR